MKMINRFLKTSGWMLFILVVMVACSSNENESNSLPESSSVLEPNSAPESNPAPAEQIVHLEVDAKDLLFEPKEIRVKKGENVHITFNNKGKMPHDLTIQDLNAGTDTISGGSSDELSFVADKQGTFQFICSVPGHAEAGMVGTIIVE
jgi:uncharacterized cupredoxin-like copper-binding protein